MTRNPTDHAGSDRPVGDGARMNAQLSLDGFEMPSVPTDGLFFAIFPEQAAAAQAVALAQRLKAAHGLRMEPHSQDRMHITLEYLGRFADLPTRLVKEASDVAAAMCCSRFDVELDHVMSFSGRAGHCPLVLLGREGTVPLKTFQLGLNMALKRAGVVRRRTPPFNPHLTLLYGKSVETAEISPIRWTALEFRLVRSFLGQGRYEVLGRWQMRSTC